MKILRECNTLPHLPNLTFLGGKYDSLIQYYGNCKYDDSTFWILMELCDAGSVKDILMAQVVLSEKHVAEICRQTLIGLSILHSTGLIHRDVKAANILLNMKGQVKLGDFGLADHLSNLVSGEQHVAGSLYWLAPEVLRDKEYSFKVSENHDKYNFSPVLLLSE